MPLGNRSNSRRYPAPARKSGKRKRSDGGLRPDNRKFRKAEATTRQEAYDKLSLKEKIEKLGDPKTNPAKKQRALLAGSRVKEVAMAEVIAPSEVTVSEVSKKKVKNVDKKK